MEGGTGVPVPGTVGGESLAQPTTKTDKTTSHFMELRMISLKATVNEPTEDRPAMCGGQRV
jgi:hypothetical protein